MNQNEKDLLLTLLVEKYKTEKTVKKTPNVEKVLGKKGKKFRHPIHAWTQNEYATVAMMSELGHSVPEIARELNLREKQISSAINNLRSGTFKYSIEGLLRLQNNQ